jgi:hypothetical protein
MHGTKAGGHRDLQPSLRGCLQLLDFALRFIELFKNAPAALVVRATDVSYRVEAAIWDFRVRRLTKLTLRRNGAVRSRR